MLGYKAKKIRNKFICFLKVRAVHYPQTLNYGLPCHFYLNKRSRIYDFSSLLKCEVALHSRKPRFYTKRKEKRETEKPEAT